MCILLRTKSNTFLDFHACYYSVNVVRYSFFLIIAVINTEVWPKFLYQCDESAIHIFKYFFLRFLFLPNLPVRESESKQI